MFSLLCLGILTCSLSSLKAEGTNESYNFSVQQFDRTKLDSNPYEQLRKVIDLAKSKGVNFAHAGILSTVDAKGIPNARVMSISKITPEGIVFYTTQESGKWKSMQGNPNATFVLYYRDVAPHVTINGVVDLNYNQNEKDYRLTVNGQEKNFHWKSFLFRPVSFQFTDEVLKDCFHIGQSHFYKKENGGSWTLSENVKYYVTPEEFALSQN